MSLRRALLATALPLLALPAAAGAALPGAPAPGTPGSLVSSFGAAAPPQTAGVALGPPDTAFSAVAVQGDGFLVAGYEGSASAPRLIVARYRADGQLDPGFGAGGIARGPASFTGAAAGATGSYASGVAVQRDGRIVVGGGLRQGNAAFGLLAERFSADGHLDGGYGNGGVAVALPGSGTAGAAMTLAPGDQVVVAGESLLSDSSAAATVARWTTSGQPDTSFDGDGAWQLPRQPGTQASTAAAVAAQADGRIVYAGSLIDNYGASSAATGRLGPTGAPESGYGGGPYARPEGGAAFSAAAAVAIAADGRVVTAGQAGYLSSAEWFASIGGAVTWGASARPEATALRYPLPGAMAVLATPRTVYVGGTAEGSQYRVMSLTALDVASGLPLAGFGAPLGPSFPSFPSGPGTTYTFVNGNSDTPTSGPGSSLRALARTADGQYVVGAGVSGSFLGGSPTPGTTRGVVALYRAVPEPATGGGDGGGGGTGGGGGGGGDGGGGGATAAAPRMSKLTLTPRILRRRTRAKLGFLLSDPATVRYDVEKAVVGRTRVTGTGGKRTTTCVRRTRRNARAKRCTRYAPLPGSRTIAAGKGRTTLTLTRKPIAKLLARGHYRLRLQATDAAGRKGNKLTVRFEVRP